MSDPPVSRQQREDIFSTPQRGMTSHQTPRQISAARDASSTPSRRSRHAPEMLTLPHIAPLTTNTFFQEDIRPQSTSGNRPSGPIHGHLIRADPSHEAFLSHLPANRRDQAPGSHPAGRHQSFQIFQEQTPPVASSIPSLLSVPSRAGSLDQDSQNPRPVAAVPTQQSERSNWQSLRHSPQSSSFRPPSRPTWASVHINTSASDLQGLSAYHDPGRLGMAASNPAHGSTNDRSTMTISTTQYDSPTSATTPEPVMGIPDHVFTAKFDNLFVMVEKYCVHHLNFPSNAKDQELPQHIKESLMDAATRETASQIAATGHTRFFLMTKVVLQWMIKHIFKQESFAGFDLDADKRIAALKDIIYQDTPTMVKHQILTDISIEKKQIIKKNSFLAFLETRIRSQCDKLWSILRPLMHQATARDWEDLADMMRQAYYLASDMATTPYLWRFEFAAIGARFQSPAMVSRDPYVMVASDEELAKKGYPVRLGYVPAVILRDNEAGVVRIANITRQKVILKS